jgi:N-acetylmuramoyl-L-alanine amidase
MKVLYNLFFAASLIFLLSNNLTAQVTGLSGWNLFIDPGHSQDENQGVNGFSEAKEALRVGLNLRELLLTKTDIDTVYMSRTNDQQEVGLTQRTDYANSLGTAWYHSIHSDAGSPDANSTVLLYGGWRQNGQTIEKIPNGGKEMSDIIVDILSRGMRIPTRGNYADRTFYEGFPDNTSRFVPYLSVNRESNMPSELSEEGFHTNPRQDQLNMNPKMERLNAYSIYWSILKFFDIARPFVGIATGIISNAESGQPVNGAVISINSQVDTTDTYASLFHLYSNDPNALHNGFYFFENLPAGTYPITVNADGFDAYSGNVTIVDTFFTFKDINLVSNVPPHITSIFPAQNDSLYPGVDNIGIIFNRPMDKASVESTLVISPPAEMNFVWSDGDKRLAIRTSDFTFNTNYQLTVSGNAKDKYNHLFDGNGNGTGGDDFILNFKTRSVDVLPPEVVDIYPPENQTSVELKPIISLSFNEQINTSTLSGKIRVIRDSDQSNVTGAFKHYIVNGRSVINLFPSSRLAVDETYSVILDPGYEDNFGNKVANQFSYSFTEGDEDYSIVNSIENFESGIGNWWVPQQSGSTTGIITESTDISEASNYYNFIEGGFKSMKLTYEWDTLATDWLIREYYSGSTSNFNSSNILQVYLFGDGSGNKFRFAVRDNTNSVEVSPWYNMDWIGWRLIEWDMTNDGTGTWIGDGVLNNPLKFDSFQLTFAPGKKTSGEIYFDDLQVTNKTTVGVEDKTNQNIPSDYALEQNYPNPFNPSTQIKFGIPQSGIVKLEIYNLLGQKIATLINEEMNSGYHSVNFYGKELSSGIYIYTLSVNDFVTSRKMVLLK